MAARSEIGILNGITSSITNLQLQHHGMIEHRKNVMVVEAFNDPST